MSGTAKECFPPIADIRETVAARGMQWRFLFAGPLALLAACQSSVPEIGRELPTDQAEANEAFDQRIKRRFPVGTDERRLVQELNRQGFKLVVKQSGWREAKFTTNYLVVEMIWSVRWRASNSIVREIWGVHFGHGL